MTEDTDDTVIVPVRMPAPAAEAPDSAGGDLERTRIPLRRIESPVVHPPALEPELPIARAFYAFSVGEHPEPISLDVACYIGRRPSAPRVARGGVPRLVRVPSPRQEVSATHLEVRQLGSSVIVTDLRSTNGSVVMVPGSVPRKLRQGESVVVSPGTLVDIGDDNILQILPIQRLT